MKMLISFILILGFETIIIVQIGYFSQDKRRDFRQNNKHHKEDFRQNQAKYNINLTQYIFNLVEDIRREKYDRNLTQEIKIKEIRKDQKNIRNLAQKLRKDIRQDQGIDIRKDIRQDIEKDFRKLIDDIKQNIEKEFRKLIEILEKKLKQSIELLIYLIKIYQMLRNRLSSQKI